MVYNSKFIHFFQNVTNMRYYKNNRAILHYLSSRNRPNLLIFSINYKYGFLDEAKN